MRRLFALATLALLFALPAFAADKKKKKKEPEPTVNVITGVNANSVDLAMGTATRSLKVTQFTEIRLNGNKVALADVRPGMTVTELALSDPSTASRLNVSGTATPVEEATPAKKKKKKDE